MPISPSPPISLSLVSRPRKLLSKSACFLFFFFFFSRGTLYSSGHYRPTPGGAGQFCFCRKCAPSKLGAVSPSDTVTTAPAAQAREVSSSGPEAHGPHLEAVLPWAPAHACFLLSQVVFLLLLLRGNKRMFSMFSAV